MSDRAGVAVPPHPSPEGKPALTDRYSQKSGRILVSGAQALIRMMMDQHARDRADGLNTAGFVSGYRGSPLADFDNELGKARAFLDDNAIRFQPGLNEDLAATSVWGSQQIDLSPGARHDGVFAMWYGKGPGVDRSMDAIRHANAAGTHPKGGVLLLMGDDHGAVSSTFPHQSEHVLISAMVPILAPAGGLLKLDPGESVTLLPGVWHAFWGEGKDVLIGEVSTVNDDLTDNIFREPIGRFADIEEDVAPLHLLVSDYEKWVG